MRETCAGSHDGEGSPRGAATSPGGAVAPGYAERALAEYTSGEVAADDVAYPSAAPPDLHHSVRTLVPLLPAFDGVAMPFMWSRLHGALDTALDALWRELGMLDWMRPVPWATLAFGRMAVHAAGWERLCMRASGERGDATLHGPPMSVVASCRERFRAARRRSTFARRVANAQRFGEGHLARLASVDLGALDTATLARGPLDAHCWTEVLIAWLGSKAMDPARDASCDLPRYATRAEQRFAGEVGRRLTAEGVLREPQDVVYLSAVERLRAVHDATQPWARLAARRARRVALYLELDVPETFFGRPSLDRAAEPRLAGPGPAEQSWGEQGQGLDARLDEGETR
jgi:hypothetical protein